MMHKAKNPNCKGSFTTMLFIIASLQCQDLSQVLYHFDAQSKELWLKGKSHYSFFTIPSIQW
jgi:hypothetical protein